jgi:PAS domain S-box-containing protein
MRWIEFAHPDDRDHAMAGMTTSWRSGAPWMFEYRMITAEGKVVWLRDRGRCVDRDEMGRPARLVGAILDVTDEIEERDRARAELSVLHTVVDAIPAVTWIESVAPDGGDPRYLYISPQVEQLLGYSAEELLVERAHFPRMIHPDDEERVDRSWREACLADAPSWEGRWRARHRDGTYRSFHARARRVSEPGAATLLWVGVSVDETGSLAGETSVEGVDAGLV